jgi:hypothetical protein
MMNDGKREWHKPKFQLLDASATAEGDAGFTTDDSSNDDFVSTGDTAGQGGAHGPEDAS